jgi:predicted outer membrane repeat protein
MSGLASTAGRVSLLICLLLVPVASANVIYVDDDAAGANDGTSWTNAFRCLQDALAEASGEGSKTPPRWPPGATRTEIRVAQGVYTPDRDSVHPDGTRDRSARFRLLDSVALRGGFAGVGATDPDARDITRYETILSGDLAGDDVVVPDPCDLLTEPTRAENSYAVVTAGACSRTTVLDGFTVRAGNAFGPERVYPEATGAGLLLSYYGADCCPSVRNCTFAGNCAYYGGATFVIGARPELIDCTFVGNAGIEGGALCTSMWRNTGWVVSACEFVVRGCLFAGNCARDRGGAVHVGPGENFTIEDCTFTRNSASEGGAIYNSQSVGLENCLLIHNVAAREGGAVCSHGFQLDVMSCTFSGNTAPLGWALSCFTPWATVTNSILWDYGSERSGEIEYGSITWADVRYNDIRGGWPPGEDNIDADPLFADPGHWDANGTPDDPNDDVWVDGDYHLKSQAGRWDPQAQAWVQDDATSPCIDAGDPNSPVGAEPEPNGGRVNLGAYGGTPYAGKSDG